MKTKIKQILALAAFVFSNHIHPQYTGQGSLSSMYYGLSFDKTKSNSTFKTYPEWYVMNKKDGGLMNDGIGGPQNPLTYSHAMQDLACGNPEKWIFPSTSWKNNEGWYTTTSLPYICLTKENTSIAVVLLGDKGYMAIWKKF